MAQACHDQGIKAVAVTAGYVCAEPRAEFFQYMDAANIDLKGFSERFYKYLTGSHLQPVLDTLIYLQNETSVWFEITNLIIPGENDSEQELESMTQWIVEYLGPDVPVHFSAFHPDWKMGNIPPTPPATLTRARNIALKNGIHHAYTGNVHDPAGDTTLCSGCGEPLIVRDWYELKAWHLSGSGHCLQCNTQCPGVFDGDPGTWGARRMPVRLGASG